MLGPKRFSTSFVPQKLAACLLVLIFDYQPAYPTAWQVAFSSNPSEPSLLPAVFTVRAVT